MPEEIQEANTEQETSPVPDEEIVDSSTTEIQDEEATSQKATEEPFHEHPRFRQLIDEKNELKQEVQQLRQHVLDSSKPKEPQEDPYEQFADEEQKRLAKQWDKHITEVARKAAAEERKLAEGELDVYRRMVGGVIAKDFIKSHDDVKKGSPEMVEITKKAQIYARSGMDLGDALEDAYKVVMSEQHVQNAAEKAQKKQQQKTKEKIAANVETSGVSQDKLSGSEPATLEDAFKKAEKEMGITF